MCNYLEKYSDLIHDGEVFDKTKSFLKLKEIFEKEYNESSNHKTTPGKFNFKGIKKVGEIAYQRAIFNTTKSDFENLGVVTWNDLELPVNFSEKPRRRCVDLIGTINEELVFVELKFASDTYKSNSPIYSIMELLMYYYLTKKNFKELDKQKVYHKNANEFEWNKINNNPVFIVGANETYWTYWKNRYERDKHDIQSFIEKIPISIRFFSSEDYDFNSQKGNNEFYQSKIDEEIQWEEIIIKTNPTPP